MKKDIMRMCYMAVTVVFMSCMLIIVGDCNQWGYQKKLIKPSSSKSSIMVQKASDTSDSHLQLSLYALSPITICQALLETTRVTQTERDDIAPSNQQQENFLDKQYLPYIKQEMRTKFTADELQSWASRDYKTLNEILRKKGFSLKFPAFPSTQVGILAIQDVLVKWLMEGSKESLTVDKVTYDGALIKVKMEREGERAGQQNMSFFANDADNTVVVKLLTQSQDIVYFVVKREGDLFAARKPTTSDIAQALMIYSEKVQKGLYPSADDRFNGVHFPMIWYDVQPDISWIEKMRIGNAHIAQAKQQIIFKMNENGARAKAATAMIVATSIRVEPKELLRINKPFLVWIERPGVTLPIFAGYMTQEYWKNPGEL